MSELDLKPQQGGSNDTAAEQTPSKKDGVKQDLKGKDYEEQKAAVTPKDDGEEAKKEAARKQSNFEAELKAQYNRQFGSKIGPKLYELVSEHLGPDALMKYAKQGLEEGLKSISKLVDDPAARAKMEQVWGPKAKEIAALIADSPAAGKILAGLSNFVREHPYGLLALALTTAVLAAMKVYSDNIDLPALEGMVKLGKNVKVGGKLDLGHIQDITVQSLHAYLQVHTSKFQLKLDVGHDAGKGEGEGKEPDMLSADAKASLTLLESSGKEMDATTKQLKREYSTKLSTTFGSTFKYNESDWSLESLKLAWSLALEARDKRLVSQSKLGELERSEYRETVFKLYANYLQQYQNVEGTLSPGELSMAMGLSLVVNSTVQMKGTDANGKPADYILNPMKWGFNWGVNYKDNPLDLDANPRLGTEAGVFVQKGNWSLGASVDYSRDLMKNQDSWGGKLTFSIKF